MAAGELHRPQGEHPERRTVHLGIDVFVEPGSEVLAPLDGRVHSARDNAERLDYGPTVLLEHAPPGGPRFHTLYGHLTDFAVRDGDAVQRGDLVGFEGSTGFSTGPHLHFEIRHLGDYVDPIPFFLPGTGGAPLSAAELRSRMFRF